MEIPPCLSRGGWYRLGGILDHQGERVSDNLESWVENALDERDGDFAALCDDFIDKKLYATRLVGQTHYLVASAGDSTDGFLQLEIEDLQEMRVHQLFANEPSTLEELVDPRGGADQPVPVGLPFYTFRRIQHIGAFLGRMLAQKPEPAPIHRMIDDWSKSSASNTSAYFNHWVIATREHLDRYHQPVFRAQPIATLAGEAPEFAAASGTTGLKLNEALSHFDRESGYPMAWYLPHADQQGGALLGRPGGGRGLAGRLRLPAATRRRCRPPLVAPALRPLRQSPEKPRARLWRALLAARGSIAG